MGEQGLVKQRVEEGYAEGRTRRRLEVDVGGVWCLLRIKTTHESGAQERGETRQEVHGEVDLSPPARGLAGRLCGCCLVAKSCL